MTSLAHDGAASPQDEALDIARTIALWEKQRIVASTVWFALTGEDRRNTTWAEVGQWMARWAGRRAIENSRAASFWQPEQLLLPGLGRRAA